MTTLSQLTGYDSQNDSGDEMFAGHDTIATLPLTHPSQSSPTQRYVTQPTQPLTSRPFQRSSSPAIVQVRASSPVQQPTPSGPRVAPMARGALNNHTFAASVAPPGTQFRSPFQQMLSQVGQASQPFDLSDDDDRRHVSDSSEDERSRARDIQPSNLKRNGQPLLASAQTPRFSNFIYNGPPSSGEKRPIDMAGAYSARERPAKIARMGAPAQTKTKAALPLPDMTMSDIHDYEIKDNVAQMRNVYPEASIRLCYDALQLKRSHIVDAMDYVGAELEKRRTVDLTVDDDVAETAQSTRSFKAPGSKPVKREAQNTKSIAQKWSSTHARTSVDELSNPTIVFKEPIVGPSSPLVTPATPPKPRRRLIQKKRAPESPILISSPAPRAPEAQKPEKVVHSEDEGIQIIDDGNDSDDSRAGSEVDVTNPELEDKLLTFLNTCSTKDLVDVSGQPKDIADYVLSMRPFLNLDAVRAVRQKTETKGKTGKMRTMMKEVGDKLVDVCIEMFTGYEAVDLLVAKCEDLGRPITEELERWSSSKSLNGAESELQIVELPDSIHDSGIGTPSSSVGDSEDVRGPKMAHKKAFLQQPAVMSRDLIMKDYQVVGLNWLSLLFSKKLSCILADDMGLGKTCQVIAFLSHLFEIGVKGPHLVVVPGSTLENWLREFQNFCPALRVEPYYAGIKERPEMRERIMAELAEINVIVTTYPMTIDAHDGSFLRHLKPVVCVYDEGHALKNPESKKYKSLMRIPAQFRLLLTGTPLQNNLQELISLLAFIMPSVFLAQSESLRSIFKQKAKTTDEDHGNLLSAQRIARARGMMKPFILRRKKHQVLKHLPAKHCRVEYCGLTDSQTAIYSAETARVKAVLEQRAAAREAAATKGKKFVGVKDKANALMDLRKAAMHPLLFRRRFTDQMLRKMSKACLQEDAYRLSDPNVVYEDMEIMTDFELRRFCINNPASMSKFAIPDKEAPWLDSGKVKVLLELLRKYMANGDRTLIFSQFTMVMDILELVFEHEGISYSRLDGSTKMEERQELIDQFYDDASIPVFMLSTKAGGAGINLACANKVVIFDGSFNPQDDVQAENRAHRVGQTREVEVVRLVCRGTVEEAIHRLGETKLVLDERVAGEGGGSEDKKAGEAVESEGIALVESMLLGKMHEGAKEEEGLGDAAEGVCKPKNEEDVEGNGLTHQGKVGQVDVKDEYMHGLKVAGLDMSAA